MKARYKLLLVVLLLWLGMSYEGARDAPATPIHRQNMTLEEQIRAYELGLIEGIDDENRSGTSEVYQGNLIARSGRNIGNALQSFVRGVLRGIVRFFDGIIS